MPLIPTRRAPAPIRAACLAFALAFAATPPAFAQWDDTPKKSKRRASDEDAAPPTGFVLTPEGLDEEAFEEDEEEAPKPAAKKAAPPDESAREPESRGGDDVPAWTEPTQRKGIVVIEENTAAPSTIRQGELDPDRAGRPLGTIVSDDERRGLSLVPSRGTDDGSFTFKANEDARPKRRGDQARPQGRGTAVDAEPPVAKPKYGAPMGLIVPPVSDDEELEEGSSAAGSREPDPFDDRPEPAPKRAEPSRRADDDVAGGNAGSSWAVPNKSAGFLENGSGEAIKVEEVKVDYQRESFLEVGRTGTKATAKPPPERARRLLSEPEPSRGTGERTIEVRIPPKPEPKPEPAPEPAPEPDPELAAPKAPEPDEPKARVAEPTRAEARPSRAPVREAAASAPAAEAPAPAGYDPFRRLENDLRALDGRPPVEPDPEEPSLATPERPRRLPEPDRREFEEPELAVKPIDVPLPAAPTRDPAIVGLSGGLAAGVLVARDPRTGFVPRFAYGVQLAWNPEFAGDFLLDVSALRAGHREGTPFIGVASSWNHFAARLLYLKHVRKGFSTGFGAGLLLTLNTAAYELADGTPMTASASQLRPGADGSIVASYGVGSLEARLDLRVLVRGGMRLDFLPTFALGFSL